MRELFNLQGRKALVTGGSKGLGLSMARGLASLGAEIFICSRNLQEIAAAADKISTEFGVPVEFLACDLTKRDEAHRLADEVQNRIGGVDILINNAGTNQPQKLIDITEEAWDRVFEVNVHACRLLTQLLAPGMIERNWGRVIFLSSIMGLASNPGRGCYSATKAAVVGMCRAFALELGPYNITVNCLAPGPILTDLPSSLLSDAQKKIFASRTAIGRWGQPDELAGPAMLLATEAGSFITGATLVVDGGLLCRTFD